MLTQLERHKLKWKDCTECQLCETRRNVVLVRGTIPAEVLFIGDAPGKSEDVIGVPFVGPAGKLLDYIIEQSQEAEVRYEFAITNIVSCIPLDDTNHVQEPTKESIKSCRERLEEIVKLVYPELIVTVGATATRTVKKYKNDWDKWSIYKDNPLETVEIVHPAAILRMHQVGQPLEIKKCITAISEAVYLNL